MKSIGKLFATSAFATMLLASNPAMALAARTWVASNGSDSSTDCTRAAPCATFQSAHNKTSAGGVINVVDAGDYGPVSIDRAITIRAYHVKAGVTLTSGSAISIAAGASDIVVLEGLDIDGQFQALNGVSVDSAAAVYIIECTIKNFTNAGVLHAPVNPTARVFVQRSNILRNSVGASVSNGSGHVLSILDSLVDGNTNTGVSASSSSIIGMARTIVNASPAGVVASAGGLAVSIGPSNIISGTGGFSATVPFN